MNPIEELERFISETIWEDESEREYFILLLRIAKGAEFLENPLIKPEDYDRGMKKYDKLCKRVLEYREMTS